MKYFSDGKPDQEWVSMRDTILEILTSDGRTVAQGALAWLWARSPQTIPIPGFRTANQVEENAQAMEFGLLTPEQMDQSDRLGLEKNLDFCLASCESQQRLHMAEIR